MSKYWTQQKEMFGQIRETRPHISILSWKYIQEPLTFCFAHILPKGMYPEYRHDQRNIVLVASIDEHNKIDKILMKHRYWILWMLDNDCTYKQIERFIYNAIDENTSKTTFSK